MARTPAPPNEAPSEFARQMIGYLTGMLHWHQLDALWQRVLAEPQGWYASQDGEAAPAAPLPADELRRFVAELDALLRREHEQDHCGIVYADDAARPTFVKIFDPRNLGSSCSCSSMPIAPRWVLSRSRPDAIRTEAPVADARRQGWRRLFGGGSG